MIRANFNSFHDYLNVKFSHPSFCTIKHRASGSIVVSVTGSYMHEVHNIGIHFWFSDWRLQVITTTSTTVQQQVNYRQEFSFWGGLHFRGSRGEVLVGDLGSHSSLQTLLYRLTAETIKIWKFHNAPRDSWPVCFTVGAKRHFGGLAT